MPEPPKTQAPFLHAPGQAIAVVGVSAMFPGSKDATGFWRDILAGRDLLTDVPASHWRIEDYYDPDPSAPDKTYAKRGGFLDPVDFDALAWGIPPATVPATDTSQLLALIVAQSVLQDAARDQFEHMDRSRISVILGVTSAQELLFSMVSRLQRPIWLKALRESGIPEAQAQAACARIAEHYVPWQEASFPGLLGNVVAGRIANRLNLGGTNCVTDAACASSLSALAMAVNELQLGQSDLAITGGVDTLNDIFMYMCFSKTPALSPTGDCRPFSAQADGTMLGEGLGMVALKRLVDAERDGDRIYAVLRGLGTASDGRSKSVYAPVSAGQALALRRCYEAAGYGPETVELVEAHGTGTKAGDLAEFEGLRMVYAGADSKRTQWCALGSVKSQIGHTKAAAGAAGLFKAVMALHHKVLPPTIKVAQPNPKLALESSPFYLNTKARPWIRDPSHPRRAAVSAFGFGGSNFHLTLEEYTGAGARAEKLATQTCELLLLHAQSSAQLLAQCAAMAASELPLGLLAQRSRQQWRSGATHRLALVCQTRAQLQQRLAELAEQIARQPEQAFAQPDGGCYGLGAQAGQSAMLFPGQGSQYLAMGADLAMQFDAARACWDRSADLPDLQAPDLQAPNADGRMSQLHNVVFPPPAFSREHSAAQQQRLTATEWAQPALAAHALSLLAVLGDLGVQADCFAGHSFGELMALHAAGALSADQALQLAHARGTAMRDAAAHPGAMSALAQPIERVRELLLAHPEVVIANHNAPRQVVVSGPLAALDRFERALASAQITFQRLPVASAFHSKVVASASQTFALALAQTGLSVTGLSESKLPVYSNSSAARYPGDPNAIRAQLAAQLAQPVRFVEMIEAMYDGGVRTFIEVGPGQVLSGLVAAILGQRQHSVIALDRKGKDGVESLLLGLARLAAAGLPFAPERLFADVRLPPATQPQAKHAIAISGSNVGKPYPPSEARAQSQAQAGQFRPAQAAQFQSGADRVHTPDPAISPERMRNRPAPERTEASALALSPDALALSPDALAQQASAPQTTASSAPEFNPRQPVMSANKNPQDQATVSQANQGLNTQVAQIQAPQIQAPQIQGPISSAWLAAFQEAQAQTAAAHEAHQRAMAGVRWGVLTGALIAGYTVIDGYAIKVLLIGPVVVDYVGNMLRVPLLLPPSLRDLRGLLLAWHSQWRHALVVATLGPLAYILVLYAVQMAPLSHVAPAREVSMLFAALIGGRLLGESDRGLRLLGAGCMAAGVVALASA